uniref:Uncharacterized protein n=1 Tax=Romanomermis culicivorax TaxID=13658 RepID=A0A915L738_ROMCU
MQKAVIMNSGKIMDRAGCFYHEDQLNADMYVVIENKTEFNTWHVCDSYNSGNRIDVCSCGDMCIKQEDMAEIMGKLSCVIISFFNSKLIFIFPVSGQSSDSKCKEMLELNINPHLHVAGRICDPNNTSSGGKMQLIDIRLGDDQTCNSYNHTCKETFKNDPRFRGKARKCDFSAIKRDNDFPQPLGGESSDSESKSAEIQALYPPDHDVYGCRYGDYEGVFYNESGIPLHCVINFEHRDRGKCVSMRELYDAIKGAADDGLDPNLEDDSTIKYKSYILKNKAQLYSKRPAKYFDGLETSLWKEGPDEVLDRLYNEAALLFNKTHGEPFLTNPDEVGLSIGVKNAQGCNQNLLIIRVQIFYVSLQAVVQHILLIIAPQLKLSTLKHAGVLRLHTKSLAPYDNHPWSPKFFNFDHMRNGNVRRSFRDMLLEIDTVLGYETSVNKMNFELGADVYDQHTNRNVFLSPHAFCTAIVELIPFSTAVIQRSLQSCK